MGSGCGSEISQWDDEAVKDSRAGKNTEPDPRVFNEKEVASYCAAKDFLEERTSKFEELKDKDGNTIITSKEIADDPARVELSRYMIGSMRVDKLVFTETLPDRTRGQVVGDIIQIGKSGNTNKVEVLHTVFHEIGEKYYRDVLTNKDRVGQEVKERNENAWKNFLVSMLNVPGVEINDVEKGINKEDKESKARAASEHFGQCFARYAGAELYYRFTKDKSELENIKNTYPEQYRVFGKMLEAFRREG